MNNKESEGVVGLAEAISDGTKVDWDAQDKAMPKLTDTLRCLHAIERVHQFHRAQPEVLPESRVDDAAATSPALEPRRGSPEPPPLIHWGHLRDLEKTGEGGAAEVYRAYDPKLDHTVALKLWRPVVDGGATLSADEFLKEARRLARVRHENVVVVHGVEAHDGRPGMWMDWVDGRTLEVCLEQQGPFGAHEAALIGMDLCRALAAMHTKGLIHRDVKTQNVMREAGGRIILMDFGTVSELPKEGNLALSDSLRGTPLTMAPEQWRGEVAGPATDIHGLGVLLYRLVTRHYPIEAPGFYELVDKHQRNERVSLLDRRADLAPDFVNVVERALDPEPAKRFKSAGAMQRALGAAIGVIDPLPPSWWDGVMAYVRSHRVHVAAAAAAVVVALGAFAWPMIASKLEQRDPGPLVNDRVVNSATPLPVVKPPGSTAEPPVVVSALTASAKLLLAGSGANQYLQAGDRVAPGDQLSLQFQCAEPTHVYVLNEDDDGNVFVLFPAPGLDMSNPLDPGSHRLPGTHAGKPHDWLVTTIGGHEDVIVIVSREPQRDLEKEIAKFPAASIGGPVVYEKVSPKTKTVLRGIGGVAQRPDVERLSDVLASAGNEVSDDVWMWQIQLENP